MRRILSSTTMAAALTLLMLGEAGAQTIAEVPREKTLIFENIEGRVPIPDNMNPYISGQNLDWGMWQATQESLFYYNLESGKLEPWLAESGTYSDDAKTVTIKVRKGAKWSDGVPFTSADIAFTIDMLKANKNLQYAAAMERWVDKVETPDADTAVIKLTNANPRFLLDYFGVRIWNTLLIAPKHIWEGVDPNTFTNFDLKKGLPLGTGPYRLVRSTETETVFDRLPNWWAAETGFHAMPAPERVIWTGVGTEDARAAMGVNNQLDAMWIMGRSTFEIARERNPHIIGWSKGLPYAYLDACPRSLFFNTSAAPLDKVAVRQAVNDAINRDQLVKVAFEGMSEPSYSVFPTYSSLNEMLKRNEATLEKLHSDPKAIEGLMQGAGFTRGGDGFWADASGKKAGFEITARSGETDKLKMGPIIVAQLRKAGFDASFRPAESAIFYTDVSNGTAAAYIADTCGSVQDGFASFAQFRSSESAPTGSASSGSTPTRFASNDYDAAVDTMAKLPASDPAFTAAADKALAILSQEVPVVPLVQARLLTPFNTTYWTNWPTAENNYVHPGHWWVTGNQLILSVKPAGTN